MLYRRLNNTGIELSILGYGCMRLPMIDNKPERIDYPKATELIRYAIKHGINYFDTAYFYHAAIFGQKGESEPFLGEALSGGVREKVYLATKLPLFLVKEPDHIESFFKEQLARLKTTYLDFYLLHALTGESWERMKTLGIREFLDQKRKEGKIRFPAFSFHGRPEDFIRICNEYDWTFAQIQFNYMDVDFQAGLKGLNYASEKGIGIVVMEPLKGGKLAQKLPPEMTAIFHSAAEHRKPADWALRYIWNYPGVTSLLSGMNTMDQLLENIESATFGIPSSLTNAELKTYDLLREAMNSRIKADCTACRYCMPCSSGVEIPDVLGSLNSAVIWNDPNPWMTGYSTVKGKAGKCTGCRECEAVCPQGLEIAEFMKESLALFKE